MTAGVLVFVVGLLVSIMLHEAGHFVTARRFGMKATQFFLGFGPTLWSTRRGETEYGVKALPLGGFVKIVGMTPLEEIDPADADRAFFRQPAGRRAVVLAAGSTVHFLLAVLLAFFTILLAGVAATNPPPVIGTVERCVPLAETDRAPCSVPHEASPAFGRLRAGDRVLAVDGTPVRSFDRLVTDIRSRPGQTVTFTLRRSSVVRSVTVHLADVRRPPVDNPNGPLQRVGTLGVLGLQVQHVGVAGAVRQTGTFLSEGVTGTYDALAHRLVHVGALFSPHRSANGLVGVVGIARISGDALSASGTPLSLRIGSLVLIIASLNLFVGIFNLLPLLPLDGGHLAVLAFESARTRVYRLLRRPDPGRVDLTKLLPATYLVVALLAVLTVLVLAADVFNPVRLGQ